MKSCLALWIATLPLVGTAWSQALLTEPGVYDNGDFVREISVGETQRRYEIYAPDLALDSQAPVIVLLHGGGGGPETVRRKSQMNTLADSEDFIVVYPVGTNTDPNSDRLFWNAGLPLKEDWLEWGETTDDVAFLSTLLDDMPSFFSIDESRVYIGGFSNGSAMTQRAAVELSDRFAAQALLANTLPVSDVSNGTPITPIPTIGFHGELDNAIPYDGGDYGVAGGPFAVDQVTPFRDAGATWVESNRSTLSPTTTTIGAATQERFNPVDAQGAPTILWSLADGGHTWPGGRGLGKVNRDISASELMWDFFSSNTNVPDEPMIVGDFDEDGQLDSDDINLLSGAVLEMTSDLRFDLTANGLVDQGDRAQWVIGEFGTRFGDADLNGNVQFPDFLRVSRNFGQPGNWSDGDFDGDGLVGFTDFLLLSNNFGFSAAITPVPEPTSLLPTLLFALVFLPRRKKRPANG